MFGRKEVIASLLVQKGGGMTPKSVPAYDGDVDRAIRKIR